MLDLALTAGHRWTTTIGGSVEAGIGTTTPQAVIPLAGDFCAGVDPVATPFGMAALVGSTQLCGMVDAPLELVFAKRAVRHTATASATVFAPVLGCGARLGGSWACPSRFPEAACGGPV